MSLLDLLEVPLAKSRASRMPTERPRVAASSAEPAPTTPAPTTSTSSSSPDDMASSAFVRDWGEITPDFILILFSSESADADPVEGAVDGRSPSGDAFGAPGRGPGRLPPPVLVPVGAQVVERAPEADGEPG